MLPRAGRRQEQEHGSPAAGGPLRSAPFYEWEEPGKRLTIQLSLDVVERLAPLMASASQSLPGRGLEVGGLLLGRMLAGDPRVTVIEDFEPLESEHLRGPSFSLSAKDRKGLEQKLRRARRSKGLHPVGYYRSHTRQGLYLDQEDFSVISSYFSDPGNVFLLVRPGAGEPDAGAFFFWEEGDMRRQSPYDQFPFDSGALVSGEHHAAKTAEPPRLEPVQTEVRRPRIEPRANGLPQERRRAGVSPVWVGGAVLALLLAGWFGIRHLSPPRETASPATEPSRLALKVERDGNSLVLSWDRDAEALRSARGAVLWITDNGARNRLDLDEKQLRQGNVVYFPSGRDVDFELQIHAARGAVTESVRTFGPRPVDEPVPPQAAQIAPPRAEEAAPPLAAVQESPKPPVPRTARRSAAAKTPARPFEFDARPAAMPEQALLTAPPMLSQPGTPAGAAEPPLVEHEAAPEVAFGYEPVRTSGIRRVFGKMKALRALARDAEDDEPLLAARPLRNLSPVIPPGIKIAPGAAVDIKVMIDPDGAVSHYQVLSAGPDPEFARLATYAARNGRFAPARMAEKAVTSELVLHYRYRGTR